MPPPRPSVGVVLLSIVVALALPACGGRPRPVELGLKRMTLDLVFKDQTKKAAVPTFPQIVAAQEPVAAVTQLFGMIGPPPPAPPSPPAPFVPFAAPPTCPDAPDGALPAEPVSGIVGKPPLVGLYPQHNHGTYTLDGPLKLKGAFPEVTLMEIANVRDVTTTDALGQAARTITYDVIERNPLSTTTTTYQSTAAELDLVSVVTKSNGQSTSFVPTPVITMMQYRGEGAFWKSAGIDQTTGTSMVVQGAIDKRESVDVCGTMIDTYRVVSTEEVTNVAAGYDSQTNANDPNVYNVATQLGGLLVRQHIDTTTSFTVNGAPSTLVLIYTSTVDSPSPVTKVTR